MFASKAVGVTGANRWLGFNRPGVAGAALQTPSTFIHSLIDSVTDPFPPNLQTIITPKLLELGS